LGASVASDLNEVMGLLDPIQGPVSSIRAYMAHECAWDARTAVETMQAIIGRLCKRAGRRSTEDPATGDSSYAFDNVIGTTCEEAT
jgi:hypothetical protein